MSTEKPASLASSFGTLLTTFVVLLLAGNGLLYVWSNNSDGAGVIMVVKTRVNTTVDSLNNLPAIQKFNSGPLINEEVFSFTLVTSVKDFWESGAYGLAIIIAGFSGLWPYIKLLLLMVAWLQPLTVARRHKLLLLLDQFGKFSFVDLFVCVFMLVSFYFNIIEPPPNSPLNKYVDVKVNVIVDPRLGMNTFVVGTLLSVLINHFMIWLDETQRKPRRRRRRRRTKQTRTTKRRGGLEATVTHTRTTTAQELSVTYTSTMGEDTAIGDTATIVPTDIQENTVSPLFIRYPSFSVLGVGARGLMMAFMFTVFWATIQSFFAAPVRFDAGGLAGIFASEKVRAFGLIDVITKIPSRTQAIASGFFLDVIFVLTLVVFPAAVCLLCFIIWFIPLPARTCRFLAVLLLPCNSLACIEVFWMAAVAASVELENVSRWIIDQNGKFSGPCNKVDQITGLDCFNVDGRLISGCWWMLYAGVGTWLVVWYTKTSCNAAFAPKKVKKELPVHQELDFGVDA